MLVFLLEKDDNERNIKTNCIPFQAKQTIHPYRARGGTGQRCINASGQLHVRVEIAHHIAVVPGVMMVSLALSRTRTGNVVVGELQREKTTQFSTALCGLPTVRRVSAYLAHSGADGTAEDTGVISTPRLPL